MNAEKTVNNDLSAENVKKIENALDKLEEIMYPKLAVIRAVINDEIPGKDIRRKSTFKEVQKTLKQIKEIEMELRETSKKVDEQRQFYLARAYPVAMAFFHSVEEASEMNVPGAREIYEDFKQNLP